MPHLLLGAGQLPMHGKTGKEKSATLKGMAKKTLLKTVPFPLKK